MMEVEKIKQMFQRCKGIERELEKNIEELKQELFNLRFQQATGNLEKPSRIRELRHTVARLKTVLKERETVEKEG